MLSDQEKANGILSVLSTLQEAAVELYTLIQSENSADVCQLFLNMRNTLFQLITISEPLSQEDVHIKLHISCRCIIVSLERIHQFYYVEPLKSLNKIKFELLPILQDATMCFFFYACVNPDPKRLKLYYEEQMHSLADNIYQNEALISGNYKYDLSIWVLAYNKLEYTKMCMESLLKNLPHDLNYELILVNNGSTDGTKEYFESLNPDKQMDIEVNGGAGSAVTRIFEGKYTLMVSNDVLVQKNSISNMMHCMQSDSQIAWVVPTTTNISNLQTISCSFGNMEEMTLFADKNNQKNPFRWEQRIRLCNPIDLRRNSVFYSNGGLALNGYYHSGSTFSYPDDKVSLLLRRGGYKMILAKDAFCHHFGSVTIKNEVQKQGEEKFYLEGRKDFYQAFGVDPWGTGFCYDGHLMHVLVERGFLQKSGHVEILGIQCGLGSNPLKIKELFREYFHQTNVRLTCLTESNVLLQDLAGISDAASVVKTTVQMKKQMGINTYHYLMIEDGFSKIPVMEAIACAWNHKAEKGYLFIRLSPDTAKTIAAKLHCQYEMLTDVWGVFYSHNRKDKFYDKSNPAG